MRRHSVDLSELELRARTATRVVYNRVPKCASTTALTVLRRLEEKHHRYKRLHSNIFHDEHPRPERIDELLLELSALREPWIFDRHLHFVDFTAHNMSFTPLYINIIRKPLERFISEYYYLRQGQREGMTNETRHMTFDECVLGNHSECLEKQAFQIIPYFCGQRDLCLTPSRQALELAKHNVIKHYSVVGLQEDLLHTFALMEQTSPQIFTDMTKFAYRLIQYSPKIKSAHQINGASDRAKQRMNKRLKLENEFYEFIKDRFLAMQVYFRTDTFLTKASQHAKYDYYSDKLKQLQMELAETETTER